MYSTTNKSPSLTEFRINNLVLAKVRGHEHWPGQIVNIDSKTRKNVLKMYTVRFLPLMRQAL